MNRFNDPPVEPVYFVDVGGTLVDIQEDFDTYTRRGIGYIYDLIKPSIKNKKKQFIEDGINIRNTIRKKAHARLFEYPCKEFIKKILEYYSITIDQNLLEKFERTFIRAEMEITFLFPDTLSFLKKSRESGKKMFIASNNFSAQMVEKILRANNIRKYFEAIYVSENIGYRKPHADFLNKIIADYHLNPQDCIMIGDKPEMDGMAAKNTGINYWQVPSQEDDNIPG